MSEGSRKLSYEETAILAESMIGSDFGGYNLIKNNCEHFANWCANGEAYSNQILSDEGEGHSICEKIFGKHIEEPILDVIENTCDSIDDLTEKTNKFFSGLLDFFRDMNYI